jgi:hypothetical protein
VASVLLVECFLADLAFPPPFLAARRSTDALIVAMILAHQAFFLSIVGIPSLVIAGENMGINIEMCGT